MNKPTQVALRKCREFKERQALERRIYNNSARCTCGSGKYCHRHRAYMTKSASVLEDKRVYRLLIDG